MKARHVWLGLSLIVGLSWGRIEAQTPRFAPAPQPVQLVPIQVVQPQVVQPQQPMHPQAVQAVPQTGQPSVLYVQYVQQLPAPTAQPIVIEQPQTAAPLEAAPGEVYAAAPAARGIRVAPWPLFDGSKREKLNSLGHCCDSHLDAYGCQNRRTQCQFAFGSCRAFFGEPCRPAPPLFQHVRARGNGAASGHGAGCNDCNR
jgi:hypothetical protein